MFMRLFQVQNAAKYFDLISYFSKESLKQSDTRLRNVINKF